MPQRKPTKEFDHNGLCLKVLAYLKAGNTLTKDKAYDLWQSWSLTQRVGDLIAAGHDIKKLMVKNLHNKGRHAVYYMDAPVQPDLFTNQHNANAKVR